MEQYNNIVELIDEQGESVEFEYLMNLDYGGREYILLRPIDQVDQDDEEDEVVILRVEQDENGDDVYTSIEDEKEANEILAAFNEIINEYES